MEAIRPTIVDVDLTKKLHRVFSGVLLAKQDKRANRMGANVFQDGAAVNLSGYTVKGYFIRNGTETIVIEDGAIIGNQAYVELPGNCYFYDGSYTLTIKLCQGGQELALVIFDGQVGNTITGAVVENENVINAQDFMQQDWLNRVETAAETALDQAAIATEAATAAKEALNGVEEGLAQVAPCILVAASGDMVTITDGAAMPVASLVTNISPAADGSGRDSVSVTRSGKNILPSLDLPGERNGVTFTGNGDGTYTVDGTADKDAFYRSNTAPITLGVLPAGQYTMSVTPASAAALVRGRVTNKTSSTTTGTTDGTTGAKTFTADGVSEYGFGFYVPNGKTVENLTVSIQIECGENATTHELYQGETLTVALPETVTDGSYDWVNGVLTKADGSTVQLTPRQLSTLKGTNNIWSDAGVTEVTYAADTKMYADGKDSTAMIGTAEPGMVATKNYASGDFIVVGKSLYKATAAIATGEAITPGTNCAATTVIEQLAAIYNLIK